MVSTMILCSWDKKKRVGINHPLPSRHPIFDINFIQIHI